MGGLGLTKGVLALLGGSSMALLVKGALSALFPAAAAAYHSTMTDARLTIVSSCAGKK